MLAAQEFALAVSQDGQLVKNNCDRSAGIAQALALKHDPESSMDV